MAKKIAEKGHNANYDFKQHAPKTPMGHGGFANLPNKPMQMTLPLGWEMRDGLRNNAYIGIDEISEIDENMAE